MRRSSPGGWQVLGWAGLGVLLLVWSVGLPPAWAERISDIRRTKHNLSAIDYSGGPTRTVKALTETELCVFCHTPHGSTTDTTLKAPLWNRQLSTTTYTGTYESTSLQADVNELRAGPGGSSKLCLSCHDGTIAIGSVGVLAGKKGGNTISMTGTGTGGVMAPGAGVTTGFTRNLGTDLSNDHPISFTYNATVATADGELRSPPYTSGSTLVVGTRAPGQTKPILPMEESKVQCASCHDPHIRDTTEPQSIKFLRLNRFQKAAPSGSSFSATNDIICLACHDKGKAGWAESVHANSTTGNVAYKDAAASLREFATGVKVWEAGCLNCHDTHTVPGARRLLREGTDSTLSPKQGGKAAVEETCFQCHTTSTASILATGAAPDIKTEFASTVRMPIATADQADTTAEGHSIINADFQENPATLGKGDLSKRHAECTDCHNPHRAMKNQLFNGNGSASLATHLHNTTDKHSHLASGALRGAWGVEPDYINHTAWLDLPSYIVKKGDAGNGASTLRTSSHVTREYQICLKCHSDYGYNDDRLYPSGNTRPQLGSFIGGTPSGTNGLSRYTNQAMEFGARANDAGTGADQGEPGGNHGSWHPVIYPTGRTLAVRGGVANTMWLSPWNRLSTDVGTLTMYCSDCHGSTTANGTAAPNAGKPWGPHGSSQNFILKGQWNTSTGSGQQDGICFKCHDYSNYATRNSTKSGFCCEKDSNLHGYHADKIGKMRCTWCHVAVPHGWKNKAFLVNLNDVGAEAGVASGTQVRNGSTALYSAAPYYQGAILKIKTWKASGQWTANDCGSKGAPGNGQTGRDWMRDGSENCANPP